MLAAELSARSPPHPTDELVAVVRASAGAHGRRRPPTQRPV